MFDSRVKVAQRLLKINSLLRNTKLILITTILLKDISIKIN